MIAAPRRQARHQRVGRIQEGSGAGAGADSQGGGVSDREKT